MMLAGCPPAAADSDPWPGWQPVQVQNDDLSIEYFHRTPCAQSKVAPVLLVPGMNGNAQTWRKASTLLARLDALCPRKIVAISLRGRGGSDAPKTGWTPAHHHRDLATVIDHAVSGPVHIVAHSMGSAYALGYALSHPSRVLGFVAGDYFAGVVEVTSQWAVGVAARAEAGRYAPGFAAGVLAEQGPVKVRRMFGPHPVALTVDYADALAGFKAPLLVILGTLSMPPGTEEMYAQAPRHRVLRIEHGHDVFVHDGAIDAVIAHLRGAPAP